MSHEKQEIITLKVPESLKQAMQAVPNRSEFIRNAILAALDHLCPLCGGSGMILPNQKKHWEHFSQHHQLKKCEHCNAVHLVCAKQERDLTHGRS
jgi:hypothetical protein